MKNWSLINIKPAIECKTIVSSFSQNRFSLHEMYSHTERGEFHISHDASRQISVFSLLWKECSRVSREIFNDLNFKMQLIEGKFQ